ncbi:MAG: hypothetical protein SH856_13740 [Flavobacteriales bacterium]|nr:hypothetical protein [Flavobacteriales bacterium]
MNEHFFGNVATFSGLLPLSLGVFAMNKGRIPLLFFVFLLYGLLTDLFVGYSPGHWGLAQRIVLNIYGLLDCLFLIYFLRLFVLEKIARKIATALLALVLPFWVLCYLILKNEFTDESGMSPVFDTVGMMVISLIAAYALLKKTESGIETSKESAFWFVIGIFFYNFCSFFVITFVDLQVVLDIWYLQNIINILAMLIYTIGFWVALYPSGHPGAERKNSTH